MIIRNILLGDKEAAASYIPFAKSLITRLKNQKYILKGLPNGYIKIKKLKDITSVYIYVSPKNYVVAICADNTSDYTDRHYYEIDGFNLIPVPAVKFIDDTIFGNGIGLITNNSENGISVSLRGDDGGRFKINGTYGYQVLAVYPYMFDGYYSDIYFNQIQNSIAGLPFCGYDTLIGNIYCYSLSKGEEYEIYDNVKVLHGTVNFTYIMEYVPSFYYDLTFFDISSEKEITKKLPISYKFEPAYTSSANVNHSDIIAFITTAEYDNHKWHIYKINPIFDDKKQLKDVEFIDTGKRKFDVFKYETFNDANDISPPLSYEYNYPLYSPVFSALKDEFSIPYDADTFYKKVYKRNGDLNVVCPNCSSIAYNINPKLYKEELYCEDKLIAATSDDLEPTYYTYDFSPFMENSVDVCSTTVYPPEKYFYALPSILMFMAAYKNNGFEAAIYYKIKTLNFDLRYSLAFLNPDNTSDWYVFIYGKIKQLVSYYIWVNGTTVELPYKTEAITISDFVMDKYEGVSDAEGTMREKFDNLPTTDNINKIYEPEFIFSRDQIQQDSTPGYLNKLEVSYFDYTETDSLQYQLSRCFLAADNYGKNLLASIDVYPVNIRTKFKFVEYGIGWYDVLLARDENYPSALCDANPLHDRKWFLFKPDGTYKEVSPPKDSNGNNYQRINGVVVI